MRSSASRPTLTVAGTARSLTNSFPFLVNQVSRPISPAAVCWAGGVGWPLGGCVVPAGPLSLMAAELAGLAGPVGAGPSEPAWPVPQAASTPALTMLMIKMGRRFTMVSLFIALTPPE
jgi:hypothetical protein